MLTFSKVLAGTAFAVAALAAGASLAQSARPKIAVPEVAVPDRGHGLDGCYRVDRPLYGPYRMTFCLDNRDGSYRVTGGGLDCRGDLDASRSGFRRVDIELNRTRCGRGMSWTADNLSCQVSGPVFDLPGLPRRNGVSPKIAVPDFPDVRQLRCTYDPAVRGYRTIQVTARKIG
jgi:hypothetical protein